MISFFFNRIPKIFILGFLFLGFTSCSDQESEVSDELLDYVKKQLPVVGEKESAVSDELLDYVNKQLPVVGEKESEAVDIYGSVTGNNFTDDETMYNTLLNDVIPVYSDFITQLESISATLETEEVQKVHEKYIEAANIQKNGFVLALSALEKQDFTLMAQANEKLSKGRKLIRNFQSDLKKLCKENNVVLSN